MALTDNNVVMPVSPMGYGNGFGGDGAWWLIVLFLFAASGNGFGGGMGGNMAWPYFTAQNTDATVQRGFDTAALTSQLSGINTSISNGFASAEVAECNRAMNAMQTAYGNQIASMNQNFANAQALDNRLDSMAAAQASCCCENRLATVQTQNIIQSEAAATRQNATANTQSILDKICQLELDAKNDKINELERQLSMATLSASQVAQTAALIKDNNAQTVALINRIAPYPTPAYVVPNPFEPAA